MIPEGRKEDKKEKYRKPNKEIQYKENDKLKTKKKEQDEEENKANVYKNQHETDEDYKDINHLTIWDLPTNINKKELEFICRRFQKAQIVEIKRSKYKALAIVQVEKTNGKEIPQAIPVNNDKLV